jgi:MtN3 and saliva related transmembrane protein
MELMLLEHIQPNYKTMEFNIEIIGLIAAVLTTGSFVPQVIKTWKTKSTENLSLAMYLAMFTGIVLWFIYGYKMNSISLMFANGVSGFLVSIILFFKFKFSKK